MSNLATVPTLNYSDRIHTEIAVPSESGTAGQTNASPTDPFWLLLPASIFFLLLPAVLTFSDIKTSWKHWQHHRKINAIIPCRGCHFFNTNIRLNCAVHPCKVLTETAVNCPDFKPKETQKHHQQKHIDNK